MMWASYPQYKDSGIEWLGQIPAHWDTKKVPWLFTIGSGTTPSSQDPSYYNGSVPWITTSELRESVIVSTEKRLREKALLDYSSLKVHPKGSIAVAMYGATIGRLGILGIPATVNQACCVFSNPKDIRMSFWFYWLQMRQEYLISLGYGGGQPNLSQELFRSIRVPIPSLQEQKTIVSFLDRETAKIDALITKKERLIELLKEKRTALISHAVTKGLDPNVPMKDSGIEWLGKIPAHWRIRKLKYLGRFIGGGTPAKGEINYWKGDVPWVSPKDMYTSLVTDTLDHITEEAVKESATNVVPASSVLIVVRSGILRHTIPVAIAGLDVALNQDMKAFVSKRKAFSRYLMYLIWGKQKDLLVVWRKEGATVESIDFDRLCRTFVPLAAEEEQQTIVNFLDRETAKIDALIAKIEEAIKLLKEYRMALISAAATGKIDVRNALSESEQA